MDIDSLVRTTYEVWDEFGKPYADTFTLEEAVRWYEDCVARDHRDPLGTEKPRILRRDSVYTDVTPEL